MRAKRSKKYRKLMHQYELAFGFREPYQVLGMKLSLSLFGRLVGDLKMNRLLTYGPSSRLESTSRSTFVQDGFVTGA
jgi:hypothetical protein